MLDEEDLKTKEAKKIFILLDYAKYGFTNLNNKNLKGKYLDEELYWKNKFKVIINNMLNLISKILEEFQYKFKNKLRQSYFKDIKNSQQRDLYYVVLVTEYSFKKIFYLKKDIINLKLKFENQIYLLNEFFREMFLNLGIKYVKDSRF